MSEKVICSVVADRGWCPLGDECPHHKAHEREWHCSTKIPCGRDPDGKLATAECVEYDESNYCTTCDAYEREYCHEGYCPAIGNVPDSYYRKHREAKGFCKDCPRSRLEQCGIECPD